MVLDTDVVNDLVGVIEVVILLLNGIVDGIPDFVIDLVGDSDVDMDVVILLVKGLVVGIPVLVTDLVGDIVFVTDLVILYGSRNMEWDRTK